MDIDRTDSEPTEYTSENNTHCGVGEQRRVRQEIVFDKTDEYRYSGGSEYGPGHKRLAENFPSNRYEQQVDSIHGYRHWHETSRSKIYKGTETGHASNHNRMGKNEDTEPYCVQDEPHRDHGKVTDIRLKAIIIHYAIRYYI